MKRPFILRTNFNELNKGKKRIPEIEPFAVDEEHIFQQFEGQILAGLSEEVDHAGKRESATKVLAPRAGIPTVVEKTSNNVSRATKSGAAADLKT